MAFFSLSGITGCISPVETNQNYEVMYNDALISSYCKKNFVTDNVVTAPGVVVVIGNSKTVFKFDTEANRKLNRRVEFRIKTDAEQQIREMLLYGEH